MQYFDASTRADEVVPVDLIAAVVDRLMPHVDGLVLIGAVARDLLEAIAGDLPVQRATHDLDVAVAVRTMGQYGPPAPRSIRRGASRTFSWEARRST